MAAILLPSTNVNTQIVGVNLTRNITIGSSFYCVKATESEAQITWRTAGTFSKLYTRVTTNNNTASSTVKFRKNTANGNQSVSIPASSTGEFQDSSNTDSVVSGDLLNYQLITGATGANIAMSSVTSVFAGNTETVARFTLSANANFANATNNVTQYAPLGGSSNQSSTESFYQFKIKTTGTLRNFYVAIISNTKTTTTTFRSRKNTANGNMLISVVTLATGVFEDTVNTDSLVSGDLVNYLVATGLGAALTITVGNMGAEFATTNGKNHMISSGTATVLASNSTLFIPPGGDITNIATETNTKVKANFGHISSNLEGFLSTNTVTASTTVTLRKNGANGNQTFSIPASTTGYFEDTTNTDAILATDELNYQFVTGATGTNMTVRSIGYLITASSVKYQSGLFWSYPI